jgi:hypothetical protein
MLHSVNEVLNMPCMDLARSSATSLARTLVTFFPPFAAFLSRFRVLSIAYRSTSSYAGYLYAVIHGRFESWPIYND